MGLLDKKILVIDDDEGILILIKKVIEGAGAVCLTASSVKEGLALAFSKAPHLIITDLSMPEIDGFTFLEKKKTIAQIQRTPVLVFSAILDRSELNRAMALGATDYLNKPLNAAQLLQKIRRCLLEVEQKIEIVFSEKLKVTAQINAELLGIYDEFMTFGSVAKLEQGRTVQIEATLLEECGIRNQVLRVDRRSATTNEQGQYLTKAKLIALPETARNLLNAKIRNWK